MKVFMDNTLHDLQLKFIIKNKVSGYIVAAFISADQAVEYLKKVGKDDYELKESY